MLNKLNLIALVLMLRVFYPGGTGIVIQAVMNSASREKILIVQQDNGKIGWVNIVDVEDSKWVDVKK